MTSTEVFMNSKFQLRAGWRIVINLVVTFILTFVLGALLLKLPSGEGDIKKMISEMYVKIGMTVATLIAAYISFKLIDKRKFDSLGLMFNKQGLKELIFGTAIGVAILTVAVVGMWGLGWEEIAMAPMEDPSYLWTGLGLNLVLFIIVGFNEEILFRGYFFQTFTEGTNKLIPTIVISMLFAAAHLANPNVSPFGIANIFLAGILLGLAYYQTQALWLPIGIHIGWNFTQGFIWGLPVSGTTIYMPLTLSQETGPDLITGGTFGPEGGAACTLVCLGACLFIWKYFKPTEEMAKIVADAQAVEAFKPKEIPAGENPTGNQSA